jgi:hypothetical protein
MKKTSIKKYDPTMSNVISTSRRYRLAAHEENSKIGFTTKRTLHITAVRIESPSTSPGSRTNVGATDMRAGFLQAPSVGRPKQCDNTPPLHAERSAHSLRFPAPSLTSCVYETNGKMMINDDKFCVTLLQK